MSIVRHCCFVESRLQLIGLVVGSIWCLLTACSVAYLYKARSEMTEEKDLEDLMKQEKSNQLETSDKEGDTEKKAPGDSNPTIPLGNSENDRVNKDDLSIVSSEMTDSADEESEDGTRRSSSVIGRSASMPVSDNKRSLFILRKISSSREIFGQKRPEEPPKSQGWKGRAKRRNAPQTKSLNDATMFRMNNNARTNRPQSVIVGNNRNDEKSMANIRVRQPKSALNDSHKSKSFDSNRQNSSTPRVLSSPSNNADFDEPSKASRFSRSRASDSQSNSFNDTALYGGVELDKTHANAGLSVSYTESLRVSKVKRGRTTRSMVSKSGKQVSLTYPSESCDPAETSVLSYSLILCLRF